MTLLETPKAERLRAPMALTVLLIAAVWELMEWISVAMPVAPMADTVADTVEVMPVVPMAMIEAVAVRMGIDKAVSFAFMKD